MEKPKRKVIYQTVVTLSDNHWVDFKDAFDALQERLDNQDVIPVPKNWQIKWAKNISAVVYDDLETGDHEVHVYLTVFEDSAEYKNRLAEYFKEKGELRARATAENLIREEEQRKINEHHRRVKIDSLEIQLQRTASELKRIKERDV